MNQIAEFRARVQKHTEDIWVDEPKDIFLIKNGYIPSGAGRANQYFSPLVMLSGEVRALGIQIFPRLLEFARSGKFSLEQLKYMIDSMLRLDCGVIAFFGLREYGDMLVEFRKLSAEIETMEEMSGALEDMFTLTNRYQLWLFHIFPWYLSVHFPKTNRDELQKLCEAIDSI